MVKRKKFDMAVIGSGPGGYIAAIRAAQFGKKIALIEKNLVGGCCLNVGCIPTKTLLSHADVLSQIKNAEKFGIEVGKIQFHYAKMKERKEGLVKELRNSLSSLIKANRIELFEGTASFEAPKTLKVLGKESFFLDAEKIVIATGSVPLEIETFPCDHKRILNSTSLLELEEVPESLAIVGGGYIGCEFASLFAELGSKVFILEALPTILTAQGAQIAAFMTKSFTKRGIEIHTEVKVRSIENQGDKVKISFEDGKTMETSHALVSVGRKVFTEGLCLEKAGIKTTEKGWIETDPSMETEVKGIYAIGDVTGKWMLAHVASHQGVVAAESAFGEKKQVRYDAVPAVVFTSPEIATVGMGEEEAKKKGFSSQRTTFPFQALGKAKAAMKTEGYVEIISDKNTGQILGASAIGYDASNLIAEMALAIENELTLESITETIHAHPTLAESWHEAAMIAKGTPLNFPPIRR